jgi:predicted nucleotidyltransferase
MTDTSLDLSGRLDPFRERIFRDVAAAAATLGIPFFLIGACARDILLDLYHGLPAQRATNDIDFGIRVETWGQFEEVKTTLTGTGRYLPDFHRPQRLLSAQGGFLDIVPFGGVEDRATRSIAWPPDHSVVMSMLGFEEAYQHAVSVRFAQDLVVSVSSLAGLALMKLIAWKDRRNAKDAKDLKFILSEYLRAGNEERLESGEHSDLLDEGTFVSVELTSARLLGRDLALLLTGQSRQAVVEILEEPSSLASVMAAKSIEIDEAFESTLRMLESLKRGVADVAGRALDADKLLLDVDFHGVGRLINHGKGDINLPPPD